MLTIDGALRRLAEIRGAADSLSDAERFEVAKGAKALAHELSPYCEHGEPLVSPEEIAAARTPAGGFTKRQLAEWGVPWPPPSGWKKHLEDCWRKR